ncbi:hypothetical protein BKA63DRAFT_514881 [Paraphoma chrysanthemicola]|nr:hypothetical protein BKA63DRAFT_514881 [Paraphoma chrysanthemicola]
MICHPFLNLPAMNDDVRNPRESFDFRPYSGLEIQNHAQIFHYNLDSVRSNSSSRAPNLSPPVSIACCDNSLNLSHQASCQHQEHQSESSRPEYEPHEKGKIKFPESSSSDDPGRFNPPVTRNYRWIVSACRIGTSALCSLIAAKSTQETVYQTNTKRCTDNITLWATPCYSAIIPQLRMTDSTRAILPAVVFTAATTALYHNQACDVYQERYLLGGIVTGIVVGLTLDRDLERAMLRILPWAILLSLLCSILAHRTVHRGSQKNTPEILTSQRTCQEKALLLNTGSVELQ